MSKIILRRSESGIDKLALRFPSGSLKGAGSYLAPAMTEEGRLLRLAAGAADGVPSWSPWRFENLVQEEDAGLLLGPDFPDFRSLDEAGNLEEGMGLLKTLARGFEALAADKALPRGIVSAGILFSLDGSRLLILPPQAAAKALITAGAEARATAVARLTSPESDGPEADASFLIAQAAYFFATGQCAYGSAAVEAGSIAPARPSAIAAVLAAPLLDPDVGSLIDKALSDPRKVGLSEWVGALEKASIRGWLREVSAEEAAEFERSRASAEAEAEAKKKRAAFWRRRGGIVAAIAIGIAVIGFVGGDMMRAQRDKPNFASLPADDLVAHYYKAIDDIDIDSLEACGKTKAFKADYNYIMNVTVLSKTRMAYEGKSPVVNAAKWVAGGEPKLDSSAFLYGIAGLSVVKDESQGQDRVLYRATYSFWSMDHKEDASGDPGKTTASPLEEKRVDLITLERSASWKGWRITELDRKVLP
jgi:hypothetical protein